MAKKLTLRNLLLAVILLPPNHVLCLLLSRFFLSQMCCSRPYTSCSLLLGTLKYNTQTCILLFASVCSTFHQFYFPTDPKLYLFDYYTLAKSKLGSYLHKINVLQQYSFLSNNKTTTIEPLTYIYLYGVKIGSVRAFL